MRTKLYVGLFVMAIVGIVAGERFFNRLRGAQEPPKAANGVRAAWKIQNKAMYNFHFTSFL